MINNKRRACVYGGYSMGKGVSSQQKANTPYSALAFTFVYLNQVAPAF